MMLPRRTVSRLRAEEPRTRRVHHSVFLVTINTNRVPHSPAERNALFEGLEQTVADLFGDTPTTEAAMDPEETMRDLFQFLSADARNVDQNDGTEDSFDDGYILDVESAYRLEVGTHRFGGRAHVHVIVRVSHLSKIHLNPNAIRRVAVENLEDLGIENVYVHIRGLGDTLRKLEIYLKKAEGFQD